ncbi:hypothetical protein DPMN_057255 [Dreissena polymorpha]|uniref:Uncharacterized protein n=1 Tax=Dreissena polymorpha TaxID=45954 RepID=A0A9D4HS75_DREPO|nr:hypothetical protein DPMN_057255 [Dreissena polymorpha]
MARQRPTRIPTPACLTQGRPRIDCIVIREVHSVKGNFGWVWPMWAGHPRVGNGAMHMNRCRNEEIIVKGNFVWVWPILARRPRVGYWAMHKVQYQLEVNQCKNEEVIVKGNFGWAWRMWVGRLRIDRIVMQRKGFKFYN